MKTCWQEEDSKTVETLNNLRTAHDTKAQYIFNQVGLALLLQYDALLLL